RGRRGNEQLHKRPAQDVEVCLKRRRGVIERVSLVGSLVAWLPELEPTRPQASSDSDACDVAELVFTGAAAHAVEPAIVTEIEGHLAWPGGGPGRFGAPDPCGVQPVGVRTLVMLHVDDNRRFIHDPGVTALAPVIEPPHRLV